MPVPYVVLLLALWVIVPNFIESIAYKRWLLPVQIAVPLVLFILYTASVPADNANSTSLSSWLGGLSIAGAAYLFFMAED